MAFYFTGKSVDMINLTQPMIPLLLPNKAVNRQILLSEWIKYSVRFLCKPTTVWMRTLFLHVPYRRKSPAMYNKHSVGNFGPFVSIADRAEALPEHAKRVSWPEPCLIGGGTKGPENCRECVYTWRGSFGPFAIK